MGIVFPVLRRMRVTGYELYETSTSKGIEHVFKKGVHVIAGINGLGKTTLLNIIYRSLVGPKDMRKEGGGQPRHYPESGLALLEQASCEATARQGRAVASSEENRSGPLPTVSEQWASSSASG